MYKINERFLRYFISTMPIGALLLASVHHSAATEGKSDKSRETQKVIRLMMQVRDYQLANPYRPSDHNWIRATYYTGLMALYRTTKDPEILAQATRWAEKHKWQEGSERERANKKTCGQTYLELYFIKPEAKRIAAIQRYVDSRMKLIAEGESPLKGWYYVDTLYVGPPTLTMLAKATGEEKYNDYMNQVYWEVTDYLFDKKYGLYYRDDRFFKAKTENGRKVFWSRGNGWAFAGIPRILQYLPRDNPFRNRYIELFRTMAKSIAACQGKDGLWRSNLDDAAQYPNPETSGTAFFCYGFAWGINAGILDKETYLPVVSKAWNGLNRYLSPEGKLGFVQRVAGDPFAAKRDDTHEYAMGLYLLSGSEIVKLIQSGNPIAPPDLSLKPWKASSSSKEIKTFARNGGWCWFQDPRAIIHDGKLVIGSVSGSGKERGDVRASVYDLKAQRDQGTIVLHPKLESDDHCAPAFYVRPDNRILAMYNLHTSSKHYYRLSEPGNPIEWGEEKTFTHPKPVSYMNLYYHPAENLLYNFYRDYARAGWCPTYVTSADQGDTWRAGGQLIAHELKGTQRPYPRYWSDGEFIHVSFTEAHPQEYAPCGIYYAKFKAGKFYKADGALIKDITKDGPLLPREAEMIFKGDPENGAWTSSIFTGEKGQVFIAYSVRKSPSDHRFRYAQWNGAKWTDYEVAYAGAGLYPQAYDYTGLIAIDPTHPQRVYFSTNVMPATGTQGDGKNVHSGKHEMYEGLTKDSGKTWKIIPITTNSPSDNLRPICVAKEGWKALLWLRGQYTTYTDYDQDVVGIIQSPSASTR